MRERRASGGEKAWKILLWRRYPENKEQKAVQAGVCWRLEDAESRVVPAKSRVVPAESCGVPAESCGVPAESCGVPEGMRQGSGARRATPGWPRSWAVPRIKCGESGQRRPGHVEDGWNQQGTG